MTQTTRVLTLNIGSSSLKAALYGVSPAYDDPQLVFAAHAERLGDARGHMSVEDAQGQTLYSTEQGLSDHPMALQALLDWLRQQPHERDFDLVGHRVVFGGQQYHEPQLITDDLVAALDGLAHFDPLHMPQALSVIAYMRREYPHIAQVTCFDTAFHRTMPPEARLYGLPYALADAGVIRYGFHGLSCESILLQLRAMDHAAEGRVIIAHLGAGASMTAVRNGVSLDTTMGFTPTGGLVMGTRSGDLDPEVVLYLLEERKLDATALRRLFTAEAGMLGVSGVSGDMRDLLEQSSTNSRAAAAVTLFCYQARKYLGALAAALGGVETLVFTGGIGERAVEVRQRICADLDFLGVRVDTARNAANAAIISADDSPVTVRVMPSDEDRMIARHTYHLMQVGKAGHESGQA